MPVVDKHTCLKVYASQQLGEISGGNNSGQENVFNFQAAGSSPADPLFIKTAIRNPLDEPRAIQLSLRGLPLGWAAQLPHAWVWLDGKAEREIEVMIWPIADVNSYRFGQNKEGKLPGLAPVRVVGFVERNYTEEMSPSHTFPGSRFYPIGGTFYRVSVRRRATIRIELGKEQRKQTTVYGSVGPARAKQRILIDVLFPDGKTHRTAETKTGNTGQFSASVSLLDDQGNVKPGPYQVRAFIFHASDLADAESNIVYAMR